MSHQALSKGHALSLLKPIDLSDDNEKDEKKKYGNGAMTSDGQLSHEGMKASQCSQQPMAIWFKKESKVKNSSSSEDSTVTKKPRVGSNGDHVSDSNTSHIESDSAFIEEPDSATSLETRQGPLSTSLSFPISTEIPTGRGTTIAILDSGINKDHVALKNKISSYSASFVSDKMRIDDILGHGTQCAGLACGTPNGVSVNGSSEVILSQGIAPEATLMVCKVVADGTKIADVNAVCDAIDHILEYNRQCKSHNMDTQKVNVMSLSFGMARFDRILSKKIQEAVYDDIIVVCAASNEGKKLKQPIMYPARLGQVLCIGSCNSNGKASAFTPVGREIDFLGFGEDVWAPTVGGENSYCVVSGTSFAAPSVAGMICLLIEDLRKLSVEYSCPELMDHMHNVWGVRELLKEMSTVQGFHNEENGYGMLNPMDYFEKSSHEKMRIIKKILEQ